MARTKKTKTVEMTMSIDYAKHWGVAEGTRELIQNALDAERVLNAKMELEHDEDTHELTIVTKGQTLEMKTLLLGISEKGGDNAVGRFGEGYKVGILALMRAGKYVEIFTGGSVWRPRFVKSETFSTTILAFDIVDVPKPTDDIRVVIRGLSAQEWEQLQKLFRFTQNWYKTKKTRLLGYGVERGYEATVLEDSAQKGRVYVGGIYVTSDDHLLYGYDLPPSEFELDRDRRSLDSWTLRYVLSRFWQGMFVDAVGVLNSDEIERIWRMMGEGVADIQGVENDVREPFRAAVKEVFDRKSGGYHPVSNIDDSAKARSLGLNPVHVPLAVMKALTGSFPALDQVEKDQKTKIEVSWPISALSESEAELLRWAWGLVKAAGEKMAVTPVNVAEPQAATFAGGGLWGLHVPVDGGPGLIYVVRSLLKPTTKGTLLVTLAHEYSHFYVAEHGRDQVHVMEGLLSDALNSEFSIPEIEKVYEPLHGMDCEVCHPPVAVVDVSSRHNFGEVPEDAHDAVGVSCSKRGEPPAEALERLSKLEDDLDDEVVKALDEHTRYIDVSEDRIPF